MLKQVCKVGEMCGCGFKNSGANFKHVWDMISNLIKKEVWCEVCREHGLENMSGLRDHIAIGIGKKPFNAKNYERFVREINCVYAKYNERKNEFGGFK